MASLNKVFLIGNLTRDPELRYTSGGTAVADLGLAVNRRFTSKNNEQKNEVVFISVTVWGKQAEACGEFLSKGSGIFIEGRLYMDSWESKDGQKQTRIKVVAERAQFLGRPQGGRADSQPQGKSFNPEKTQDNFRQGRQPEEMDNFALNDGFPEGGGGGQPPADEEAPF